MSELISFQKAIEKINERARETFTLDLGYEYYLGALHDVTDDLRQISTVDAVPVVHAHLIKPDPYGECSSCGYLIDIRQEYNYCPNCGAKMDGERKDDG